MKFFDTPKFNDSLKYETIARDYVEELRLLDKDNIHPEFHTFVTVWIRSNAPEIYTDLKTKFSSVEGEIFARMQESPARSPF
jgi:hypothetical protein